MEVEHARANGNRVLAFAKIDLCRDVLDMLAEVKRHVAQQHQTSTDPATKPQ